MHVFTYGSLMFEQVWSQIVGGQYITRPGRLYGFVRKKVKRDVYPVVYKTYEGDWVDGLVYLNVADDDIARLDKFEGDFYSREEQPVVLEGGERVKAAVYVLRDCFRHVADDEDWDVEWFSKIGVRFFLGRYRGFRS